MRLPASAPTPSRRWARLLFGGAGPRVNRERRELIDQVRWELEMWRDCDDPACLARARNLLDGAA